MINQIASTVKKHDAEEDGAFPDASGINFNLTNVACTIPYTVIFDRYNKVKYSLVNSVKVLSLTLTSLLILGNLLVTGWISCALNFHYRSSEPP